MALVLDQLFLLSPALVALTCLFSTVDVAVCDGDAFDICGSKKHRIGVGIGRRVGGIFSVDGES